MTTTTTSTGLTILYVEDNPGDVRLVEEAFASVEGGEELRTVSTGSVALDLLFPDEGSPPFVPDIVLLDRDLPGVSGIEVLRAIKTDADLRHIPVIILTDSDDKKHVTEMYDAHANAYVTKPSRFDDYRAFFRCLRLFLGQLAEFPSTDIEQ